MDADHTYYKMMKEEALDEQMRILWARYAARKHGWPNGLVPAQDAEGRFVTDWHEAEYEDFRAGWNAAVICLAK